jgi:xanthine dehydrogenase small subunit
LLVQKADEVHDSGLTFFSGKQDLRMISVKNGRCCLGAEVTMSEMMQAELLQGSFPNLEKHFRLIASTPIRNRATLAGNIVNASPIADLAVFLLALEASVLLESPEGNQHEIPLKDFYIGYKKLKMDAADFVREIRFALPGESEYFNFEKVSKREFLDIATVNCAILLGIKEGCIEKIHLSAGGVAPIPLYLEATCRYLAGKIPDYRTLLKANEIMQQEISPISDIRGSIPYKRLLLRQLFFAHFLELFPGIISADSLVQNKPADEKQ